MCRIGFWTLLGGSYYKCFLLLFLKSIRKMQLASDRSRETRKSCNGYWGWLKGSWAGTRDSFEVGDAQLQICTGIFLCGVILTGCAFLVLNSWHVSDSLHAFRHTVISRNSRNLSQTTIPRARTTNIREITWNPRSVSPASFQQWWSPWGML